MILDKTTMSPHTPRASSPGLGFMSHDWRLSGKLSRNDAGWGA